MGATIGSTFIRVKLKPNLGVKIAAILKLAADIQVQLGIDNPPLIAPQSGFISVADSKIILDGTQIEAAYLLGKGDLLYQVSAQLQRLQSLFAAKIQLP